MVMTGPPSWRSGCRRPGRTPATARDVIASATDDEVAPAASAGPGLRLVGAALPMIRRNARAPAPFEHGMHGDDAALVEDADHVGELLHLDDAAGAVRHAVEVAADRRRGRRG